jgi:hypothetical protein
MRHHLISAFLILAASASSPAWAQLVAPLVTADGKVACVQGMTGIGHPARWEAVPDSEAPHNWALAETRDDATDLHFPLCICQGVAAQNLGATLRFKPLSGTKAQTGGLMLRAQNANDYYVVAANALDGSVRLFRMVGGRRAQLAAKEGTIARNQWHDLKVTVVEDRFEVWLDGTLQFKARDKSLLRPGAIGVWTQADSLVHFGALVLGPPS